MKSTWSRLAWPAYCRVQLPPPSLVAMIRPAPATQPWPESTNWTAASAGAWPDPDEAALPVRPAQDEAAAGGTAVPCELAEPAPDGVDAVPADAFDVAAGP